MDHLSEVLRILEAALRHDPSKAINYATLLASKLEEDSEGRQARAIRSVLAKAPTATFQAAGAHASVPVDEDSRLQTVDIWTPTDQRAEIVLHPFVEARLRDFLDSVKHHDEWLARGVATPNRLLVYGPPGTGKTSLARLISAEVGLPLVTTRSDTLVSSLLGQTSRNIRNVFGYAEKSPCVLFLDEFDALAKERNDSREIGELQRVVIALLQNIDALPSSTILVAATNHEELLDRAVWRRFEHTIEVGLPGLDQREAIWRAKLKDFALPDRDMARLVEYSAGLSGAAIETAARDILRVCISSGCETPTLPMALRRLARVLWYNRYEVFDSPETEMAALRAWAPTAFSIRALAELFGVSTRQVLNATRGVDDDGVRADRPNFEPARG